MNPAEELLDLAARLQPRTIQCCSADSNLATIRTALDFARRPIAFRFRALAEAWSAQDIVREMY